MSSPSTPPPSQPHDEQGLPIGWHFRPEWEVTPRYVRERLMESRAAGAAADQRPFLLVDCRRDDEVHICRIGGAAWVPMHEIENRLDEIEHDAETDESGPRDHEVVVYCHHGRRSLRVAATLRGHGFTNVKSMAGGIDAWSAAIDPTVPRY